MANFIREAGWGIYPVLLFGALATVLSIRYAMSGKRELLPLVVGFVVVTLLSGGLGTISGIQVSAMHIEEVQSSERWIFLLGLREALNNLAAAFVVATLNALIATAGAYRSARQAVLRPAHLAAHS